MLLSALHSPHPVDRQSQLLTRSACLQWHNINNEADTGGKQWLDAATRCCPDGRWGKDVVDKVRVWLRRLRRITRVDAGTVAVATLCGAVIIAIVAVSMGEVSLYLLAGMALVGFVVLLWWLPQWQV